jgi:hypothetical protein
VGFGRARWRNDGLALRRLPRGEGPMRQEGLKIRDALRTARAYLHINPHPSLQSRRKVPPFAFPPAGVKTICTFLLLMQ